MRSAVSRRGRAARRPDHTRPRDTPTPTTSGHGRPRLEHGIPVSVHADADAESRDSLADGTRSPSARSDPPPAHARPPARAPLLRRQRPADGRFPSSLGRPARSRGRGARARRGLPPDSSPSSPTTSLSPRPRRLIAAPDETPLPTIGAAGAEPLSRSQPSEFVDCTVVPLSPRTWSGSSS
jgi:hypothetical protein